MSTKIVEEKKVYIEKVNKVVCDLCDKIIEDKASYIRVGVSTASYSPEKYLRGGDNPHIDICTPECLVKNANGISVVLNTKLIPESKEPYKYEKKPECVMVEYKEVQLDTQNCMIRF